MLDVILARERERRICQLTTAAIRRISPWKLFIGGFRVKVWSRCKMAAILLICLFAYQQLLCRDSPARFSSEIL